jgi:hypothetical protein
VPDAPYVRNVVGLAHVAAGGIVQVTPLHGSPLESGVPLESGAPLESGVPLESGLESEGAPASVAASVLLWSSAHPLAHAVTARKTTKLHLRIATEDLFLLTSNFTSRQGSFISRQAS